MSHLEPHLAGVELDPPIRSHERSIVFQGLYWLNRVVCRIMYRVTPPTPPALPPSGPALLACDHTSYSDALALLATAGRPIRFVVARDVYDLPHLRWVFRAAQCIPVRRGTSDVVSLRAMLNTLRQGEVLGLFPEGGIDDYRSEGGHPGVGYLALKTGVPVIPASILWKPMRPPTLLRSLLTPGQAVVRYGTPLTFRADPNPSHENIRAATAAVMAAIRAIR